jgi:uncharacterized protein (UPF0332 family)
VSVEEWTERARGELARARRLVDQGEADLACVQAFYAAFYAVQGLLTTQGPLPKTHRGTLRQFSLLAHEAGEDQAAQLFKQLETRRVSVHYGGEQPSPDEARRRVGAAEVVLQAVERLLERK